MTKWGEVPGATIGGIRGEQPPTSSGEGSVGHPGPEKYSFCRARKPRAPWMEPVNQKAGDGACESEGGGGVLRGAVHDMARAVDESARGAFERERGGRL